MIRFLLRLLGFLLLAGGFAALVIDGTRSIAAEGLVQTGFAETLRWAAPQRFAALEHGLREGHAWLWTIVATLLAAPSWIVLSVLGIALLILGRPRAPSVGSPERP